MTEFLADGLQSVGAEQHALQFRHALLGVGVPCPVGAGGPAERALRGARETDAPWRAAGDVVSRQVVDAAVRDPHGFVEPARFKALGKVIREAHDADQAALADDGAVASRPARELAVARGSAVRLRR